MSLSRFLAPLKRRLQLLVGRGVLALINDSEDLQELQIRVLAGETHDGVERFQQYGFTSHPFPGAEHVTLFMGGNREHGLTLAVDDRRYRLKSIEPGEVALYTDEDQGDGHRIHLKRGNEIHLVAGQSSIVMTPARITMTSPAVDMVKV